MIPPRLRFADAAWASWAQQMPAWDIHLESGAEALMTALDLWIGTMPQQAPARPERIMFEDWLAERDAELTLALRDSAGLGWSLSGVGVLGAVATGAGLLASGPLALLLAIPSAPLLIDGVRTHFEHQRQIRRYARIRTSLAKMRARVAP